MSTIKVNRALKIATIGDCPGSASDMLGLIPAAVIQQVNSRTLAALIDGMWQACQASKAIAAREAIDEGAIWDARRERMVELVA